MTTKFRVLRGERLELYSPIGLNPIDDVTGAAPIGWVRAELDLKVGANWSKTSIKDARSASGIIIYPALGRQVEVQGQLPRRYRVRITAQFYIAWYRQNLDGIEFDAFPYNDAIPPQVIVSQANALPLSPAVNYPFPGHIAVLRGVVADTAGNRIKDVEVKRGAVERVLTDERGTFALPLRWTANNVSVSIDATDHRTNRTGTINVTLPQDLRKSQTIVIN